MATYIWNIKEQYKQKRANLWSRGDRAVFGGGYTGDPAAVVNVIQSFNISSLGNAADFGNLAKSKADNGAYANTTRGIFSSG